MTEEFIRKISAKTGKVISEHERDYLLILTNVKEKNVVICFREGNWGYYTKIVLEKNLSFINCMEAEYSPTGLYAFAQDIDELVEKTYSKIINLITRNKTSFA